MKIAICGDSISEGIGSKKINYIPFLEKAIENIEVKNFALTGTMITYMYDIKIDIKKYDPEVLVIFYGNVDAMSRPNSQSKIYKIIPARYKKNGMLSPRALYSSNLFKKFFQKIESNFRTNLNRILIKTTGYEVWNPIDKFTNEYSRILNEFKDRKIILISTVPVFEKWFPNTNNEYIKYNAEIMELAKIYNCKYLNAYDLLSEYNKNEVYLSDYFHLSEIGYKVLADEIIKYLSEFSTS